MSRMAGGLGDAKTATSDVQQLVDQMKPEIEMKENKIYSVFIAVEYKTQVVAGTNYFVKVDAGQEEYLHLRIFKPLPQSNEKPSLTSYQTGKTASDPLNYF